MSQIVDKSNLGYLGADYQYKLVKCFMEEPRYFAGIYSNIDQSKFTEPLLTRFVGVLKDYFSDKGFVPSYDTMLILLKKSARMECDIEESEELIKKLKDMSTEGIDVVEEEATRFFRQQSMIKLAKNILEKAGRGDDDYYEESLVNMQKIISSGEEEDMGFNPYDYEEEALSEAAECPIPTGIGSIDEALGGGLKKQKMGVIIAAGGFGKTTISTAMASYASTFKSSHNNYKGFKVLQIFFEDANVDIAKKHFSRITDIEARLLNKKEQVDNARQMIEDFEDKEMFKENILCKRFPSGKKTITDIKIYLRSIINKGFKPDLVILDYFECLALEKGDRNASRWDREGDTMRALDVMTKDYDIALWMTTQGNKDSFISDVVKMNQAGGSVTKVQIGGVIMSIARSLEDQDNNRANIAMLKNRQGKSGQVFEVIFNNGTSRITCSEVQTYDSALVYENVMKEKEEAVRNRCAREIAEQMNKERNTQINTNFDNIEKEFEDEVPVKKPMGKKKVQSSNTQNNKVGDDFDPFNL